MQSHVIQCQIRSFSVMAEIEGMKVENACCLNEGKFPKYTEKDFIYKANHLEELARDAGTVY